MKTKWLIFIILVVIAIVSYNYIYKSHRDIKTEKTEFSITSLKILNEFSINPVKSEKKYLNKTIEIKGRITEKSKSSVTLDDVVFCQFSNQINTQLKEDTHIIIKGRYIGYDDLLEQIKLDQCNIIQ